MKPLRALLLLLCLLAPLASATGCADQSTTSAGARPVDPALIAFLSKARAAHHVADLAEAKGETGLAVRELTKITEGARPLASPEVIEVLSDAHARIAGLLARDGASDEQAFERALAEIDKGLALATEISHFRGHLFEVRGTIYEAMMKAAEKRGDTAGAAAARKSALEALTTAIDVQESFILQNLPASPSANPSATSMP